MRCAISKTDDIDMSCSVSLSCFNNYVDVDVSESDGAVGNEASVKGIKVGNALHVRYESGHNQ